MDSQSELELKYDSLALDFFQLVDRKKLSNINYYSQLKEKTFFSLSKQEEMNVNIPLKNEKRIPEQCDVLTTFMSLNDEKTIDYINNITDDILTSFPSGIDYYRSPKEDFHISLVMLHDLRPIDMTNKVLQNSKISREELNKITYILDKEESLRNFKKIELTLYGFRIVSDGSIIALFIDNGETLGLREKIGNSISSYLQPQHLNYKKPFIHITVARFFEQITYETLLKVYKKQRQYFYLADKNIRTFISKFHLAHESEWMHSKINIIKSYNLA